MVKQEPGRTEAVLGVWEGQRVGPWKSETKIFFWKVEAGKLPSHGKRICSVSMFKIRAQLWGEGATFTVCLKWG